MLPEEPEAAVQWTSISGYTYRFTNVGPGRWIVHRRDDHDFEARLSRADGLFDFWTERGNPSFTATSISLGEVLSKFL
ncbi:MAG: hypothetical protein BGO47_05825 [Microbacterium sp. 67-17]|nr:MAG: hypothetical protein BGO47_05825 [Microbacterium sp. 67-17]